MPMCRIVVPAHNEELVIDRLLDALFDETRPGEFAVTVVANGCTDHTVSRVRRRREDIAMIELAEGSKRAALRTAVDLDDPLPVVFVDADVIIDATSVRDLIAALDGRTLASAPTRRLDLDRSAWPVRAYYHVWEQLPQVRDGLFGRGVIAVRHDGQRRLERALSFVSDDLAFSEAFGPDERCVVRTAVVTVTPPRHLRDLIARRTRVVAGNEQYDRQESDAPRERTSLRTLANVVRAQPQLWFDVPVFIAITLSARWRARGRVKRREFDVWDRDESSRGS